WTASLVGDDGELELFNDERLENPLDKRKPKRKCATFLWSWRFIALLSTVALYAIIFAGVTSATGQLTPRAAAVYTVVVGFPAATVTVMPTLTAEEYNNRGVANRALGDFEAAI